MPATRPVAAADPVLARWIRHELAADPPRVPSLIVTVWGDALVPHGGVAWLAALIRLLADLGVNERAVRTGIFRVARDGWLEAEPVGRRSRYRLTAGGSERFARAFHRVYDAPFEPWDGEWEAVVAHGEGAGPAARRRLRDELAWAGFAAFAPGVHLRPARRDGAPARIVDALGAGRAVIGFDARESPDADLPTLASRAESVYALAALAGDYRRFLARFSGVTAAFRRRVSPDPAQAFAIRTLLVHAYRRVRLRDPQLPREVLPPDWPGADAYRLCRDFYRVAQPLAQSHLAAAFAAEGEALPPVQPSFYRRFAGAI
ncbi:Transcriptional repressor PaaX [Burkholderiales bacterium]|nr:Transcriptional repressor PaaX [Burkholderiales bacterium]